MTTESILKKHFPMLRTAEEVMQDIQENPHLRRQYQTWQVRTVLGYNLFLQEP